MKKNVFLSLAILTSYSCSNKLAVIDVAVTDDVKQPTYQIRASDGEKINGFLYCEFRGKKFKQKLFARTDRFDSNDLKYISDEVNTKVPTDKMLISKFIINDSSDFIGLYYVNIMDFNVWKIQTYLHLSENISNRVKGIHVPVLKFNNSVGINKCYKCSEEDLREAKITIQNFKEKCSDIFTPDELKSIETYFMRGMNIYVGHGRYRN